MNPKTIGIPLNRTTRESILIGHDLRHRFFLRALKLFSLLCFSRIFLVFLSCRRFGRFFDSFQGLFGNLPACVFEIGFPVRSEYFTFGSRFSLLLLSFLRSKTRRQRLRLRSLSTRFCTGCNDDGFRPFIPAFLPFAASTVTSTIRRFLRDNEETKRTFVRPGSVAREDAR